MNELNFELFNRRVMILERCLSLQGNVLLAAETTLLDTRYGFYAKSCEHDRYLSLFRLYEHSSYGVAA